MAGLLLQAGVLLIIQSYKAFVQLLIRICGWRCLRTCRVSANEKFSSM
jgi:hypothetical protein